MKSDGRSRPSLTKSADRKRSAAAREEALASEIPFLRGNVVEASYLQPPNDLKKENRNASCKTRNQTPRQAQKDT